MKLFNTCCIALCALYMTAAPHLSAQIVWCEPKAVRWGDTVRIYYNPQATGATFSLRDEVYARLYITMSNGTYRDTCFRMLPGGKMLLARYVMLDSAAYADITITVPEDIERISEGGFIALQKDGVPARKALERKIWDDSTAFEKEQKLYPDNYHIFLEKWLYLQYGKRLERNKVKQEVLRDVQKLATVTNITPEILAALAEGYGILEKKQERLGVLRRLAKEFPQSVQTYTQLLRYSIKEFQDSSVHEIRSTMRILAATFPKSTLARETVKRRFADTLITLALAKPILEQWIYEEPQNPAPYNAYLDLANRENIVSDTAVLYAQKLTDIAMNKDSRVRYYLNNARQTAYILHLAARTFRLNNRAGQALAAFKTAQFFTPDADTQSNIAFDEGLLFKEVGQYSAATEALVQALVLGNKKAKDSLLVLYKQARGTDSGFAAFVKQKTDSIANLNKKPALTFTAKGLDGKTYDIAKLKGKVVVLNFWFINCGPCRLEIPSLNTLVKEFVKKDVVFLALALDEEKELKEFLKKTPFAYTIIPNADEIIVKQYGVEGFPTHIVIDRDGMNIGQLVGGSEKRHEDIRPLIERALEK